jgi:hypothetical protein
MDDTKEEQYFQNIIGVLNRHSTQVFELERYKNEGFYELKINGQTVCEDGRRFLARLISPESI